MRLTDADTFVANDRRHDDALLAAARFSSFYIDHPMGVFRLNTTGQDPEAREPYVLSRHVVRLTDMNAIAARMRKAGDLIFLDWEPRKRVPGGATLARSSNTP